MMGKSKKSKSTGLGAQLFRKLQGLPRHVPPVSDAEGHGEDKLALAILDIYHPPQKDAVAQVILNGYNIDHIASFGALGAMRSFKIVTGALWDEWNEQTAVVLTDEQGVGITIRIAALPSDDDSFGLIEFVS